MLEFAVAQYLDDSDPDVDFQPETWDGNLYIFHMPAQPDLAVALWPTGGPQTDGGSGYDERTMQVMVRGAAEDPLTPKAVAERIYGHLTGLSGVALGEGTEDEIYVVNTQALQSAPEALGQDENFRYRFVQNFSFHVRNKTQHRK